MAKRHERTLARRMAVQALYTSDITREPLSVMLDKGIVMPDQGPLPDYAEQLLRGIDEHSQELDDMLAEASRNWAVERMPLVDYAILRMAAYEITQVDEVPVSVCINEAVELAKEFGGEDNSARFANGILGQIARKYAAGGEAVDLPEEEDEA